MPAFDLSLFGVGTFGDRRKVHTLWAGVRPSPGLSRLQETVDNAVLRAGLPPARRTFSPNVMLAGLNKSTIDSERWRRVGKACVRLFNAQGLRCLYRIKE